MGAKDIKPYGDLLHEAKLHGGVDQYINDIEAGGIAKGKGQGRLEGTVISGLAMAIIGLGLFAKTKWDAHKAKVENEKAIISKGEESKKILKEELSKAELEEMQP